MDPRARHPSRQVRALVFAVAATAAGFLPAAEPEAEQRTLELAQMPLDALMNIEVTTLARRSQRIGDTAAAVHVITREDMRRAGLTSIPEALRLVPGLHVARIDSHNWAITARGFNRRTANKLLVQIDGRTVYTPLFAGVFWDMHDLPLEDLDHIEVVLGPGGTLWGANAVNGIINVISRSAAETQGVAVEAGAGSLETADVAARYGGALGEAGHFRVYAKRRDQAEFETATGAGAGDDWHVTRGGFRADLMLSSRDAITVEGNMESGRLGQTALVTSLAPAGVTATPETLQMTGANLRTRWERSGEDGARTSLQAYWDHVRRDEAIANHRVDVLDLDFEHHFAPWGRHALSWGLAYRLAASSIGNKFTISLNDTERHDQVFSAFVHDQIQLRDDLLLSVGSKVGHNDFTGFEVQPSARLLWNVTDRHSLWAAVTRAVRTPTPIDATVRFNQAAIPGAPPTLVSIFGNPEVASEKVLALEVGFRGALAPRLSLDLALYYNRYEDLIGQAPGTPAFEFAPAPAHVLVPLRLENLLDGESLGLEAQATWRATEHWRLSAGYSLFKASLHAKPGVGEVLLEGSVPEQQVQVHSRIDLPHHLAFDVSAYRVGTVPAFGTAGYTRLDLRLGWTPRSDFEASLGVRNLLDDRHPEYTSTTDTLLSSEVPRGVYARAVWRW